MPRGRAVGLLRVAWLSQMADLLAFFKKRPHPPAELRPAIGALTEAVEDVVQEE